MFDECVGPVALKNPSDLRQNLGWVFNGAKSPGRHHMVDRLVFQGKRLARSLSKLNNRSAISCGGLGVFSFKVSRVDRDHFRDGWRIKRQIQSCSKTDFQNNALEVLEDFSSLLSKGFPIHHPIHQNWKNVLTIDTHGSENSAEVEDIPQKKGD